MIQYTSLVIALFFSAVFTMYILSMKIKRPKKKDKHANIYTVYYVIYNCIYDFKFDNR